jgi:molybdopterin/thiamine biosynthesis adenylyltransferase
MSDINSAEFSRNYGFWNEREQKAIIDTKVAIAGVGGDGFQLGLKLARIGVQTFDIADPELFEPENANRVPGATTATYGRNKAEVFHEKVLDINPEADVRIFTDGVTEANVDEFTDRATLLFDESELTHLEVGAMLARASRERKIPDILVMNIGFAAVITSFNPESKWTFEKFMGIPQDMPLDEIRGRQVAFDRCLPYLPRYGDLNTLRAVQEGAPLPSIAPGVDVASALGVTQALKHITIGTNHREKPIWAPHVGYMDAYTLESGVTCHPRYSHYSYLARAVLNNLLGSSPAANYTNEDRARREAAN